MSQPAFPTMGRFIEADGTKLQDAAEPGMTLRDYFAAKAIGGDLTESMQWKSENAAAIAALGYKIADAMLAERAKS